MPSTKTPKAEGMTHEPEHETCNESLAFKGFNALSYAIRLWYLDSEVVYWNICAIADLILNLETVGFYIIN